MTDAAAKPPRTLMLTLSLAQGLMLLGLWRALDTSAWPSQTPALNFALFTFALSWPTLLLFTLAAGNVRRAVALASAASGLLTLCALYVGWQASPINAFPVESLVATAIATLLIAGFKVLMFMGPLASGTSLDYGTLFRGSWRNFLVAGLAAAQTLAISLLLMLWAALFDVIGIEFFSNLFSNDWFLFPVLAVAFGFGVLVFRNLTRTIDGITALLEGLMRLLLPLVLAVVAVFLAALPFTGLAPLWGTGNGTALLMALNALALFFLNAAYQTGEKLPYPASVHHFISAGLTLLPIISALALYGLYLRIDQYGWTVERCWALTIALLLALFSCGYAVGVIRRWQGWTVVLRRVNIGGAALIGVLMLVVNSPLLDFRKISTASQFGRAAAEQIPWSDLDFAYVKNDLARPGHAAMQALREELEATDPALAADLSDLLSCGATSAHFCEVQDSLADVILRPEPFAIPDGLKEELGKLDGYNWEWRTRMLVRINLSRDGEPGYAAFRWNPNGESLRGQYYVKDEDGWDSWPLILRRGGGKSNVSEWADAPIAATEPLVPWQDLRIGSAVFKVDRVEPLAETPAPEAPKHPAPAISGEAQEGGEPP